MNVAPNFTLDAIEAIVIHPEVNIRGMLLTLKLPEWRLASAIPAFLPEFAVGVSIWSGPDIWPTIGRKYVSRHCKGPFAENHRFEIPARTFVRTAEDARLLESRL